MSKLDVFSMYSPAAGSTRVRVYDWLRHLGVSARESQYAGLPNAGVGTLARHRAAAMRAEVAVRRVDVAGRNVLMSREASPFSRGEVEERILRSADHSAYDFDDALFHDTSIRRRAFGGASKFERAVRASDTVIAGNEYLAEWAAAFNDDVRIIPSCVEPSDYRLTDHVSRAQTTPTLVWLGSASTEQYLVPLIDQLLMVHRATGARLKLISSPHDNPELTALMPMLDRVPWAADTFAAELSEADIALAPLDDNPYARGKCAYKILQYGAAGLSVVGTPVGANALALSRVGGRAVTAPREWGDALQEAIAEPADGRATAGRQARQAIEEHYSFATWSSQWSAAVL